VFSEKDESVSRNKGRTMKKVVEYLL